MGQKIDLKNSVEDVDGFKTNSLYFNGSMASFGDIRTVTFSCKVLWTMIFPRTNFFSFTMQTPQKPRFPL